MELTIAIRGIITLFVTSQLMGVDGQSCDVRCAWQPWNAWSACTATCGGGYQERDRSLCCATNHDLDQCLAHCGLSISGFEETRTCGGTCYNGHASVTYPASCSCGTAYYGSCCENRIQCAQPPSISHGDVTTSSVFYYGASVTYTCDAGYNLTAGDSSRTCRRVSTSGYWTGQQPRCAYAISCASQPCQNGGTCVNGLDLYTCFCDTGWSGTNCEFDILPPVYDDCPSNITEYTSQSQVTLTWNEPIFTDPHGESDVHITAENYPEPEATLPWGEYIMQYAAIKPRNGMTSECLFSSSIYPNPCTPLVAPTNGSIACNGWNSRFGEICTLFCESTADVPPNIRIENVYVCGATGNWLPTLPPDAACSETRTALSAANQNAEQLQHYYSGHCSEPDATRAIQQAFIDILESHDLAHMCTADRFIEQCIPENVAVNCN